MLNHLAKMAETTFKFWSDTFDICSHSVSEIYICREWTLLLFRRTFFNFFYTHHKFIQSSSDLQSETPDPDLKVGGIIQSRSQTFQKKLCAGAGMVGFV